MQRLVRRVAVGPSSSRASTCLLQRGLASLPGYVTSAPVATTKKLGNGISVATEAAPGDLAVVSVWIDSGSRYEAPSLSGASNLISRVALKGYEGEISKVGGKVSAWTSREMTVFSATVLKSDVAAATDLLGKIVTSPKFTDADVDAEKAAVLSEIDAKLTGAHDELLLEHLHATAFQGTPLAQPIAGSPATVSLLSKSTLVDFMKGNFLGSRIAVAGTGAVSADALASAVGSWAVPSAGHGVDTALAPSIFTGSDIRARFDAYPLAHVALAFQGFGWTSKYQVPLLLAQTILGSWDKSSGVGTNGVSELSRIVAEQDLAVSFSAFNLSYKDAGLFGIVLLAPENKLDDLMWYTLHYFVSLVHRTSDEQLAVAKAQLKANYLASISSVSGANDNLGRQLLAYGRVLTPAEFFSRVDAVTVADVKAAADQVINDQDHALAAVGPLHELPDYNWIRRRSYWLRY